MAQAAKETGKVLAEAFMYRHHPQTLKAKEIVDSGALGKIQLVKGAFTFNLTREGDIRFDKEMGGGSVWDVGCYPISFARMIVGADPLEVFGWQVTGQTGIDDSFYGQMKFENGVHAQFDSGFKSPFRTMIEIVGTEGTLSLPSPFKPERNSEILLSRGDEVEKIKIKGGMLYMGEVDDMCDAITQNKATRVSLADSRGNVATILALLESAQSGKPVSLAKS
jgi:predicted dehydrogenase